MRPLHDPDGGRRFYPNPEYAYLVETGAWSVETALAAYRQHPWVDGRCTACGVPTEHCEDGHAARKSLRAHGYPRPLDDET